MEKKEKLQFFDNIEAQLWMFRLQINCYRKVFDREKGKLQFFDSIEAHLWMFRLQINWSRKVFDREKKENCNFLTISKIQCENISLHR